MIEISLQNKTALICGSSQGIGFAIAEAFAKAGANCLLLSRNEESLKQALKSLPVVSNTQKHEIIVADLSDMDRVDELAGELKMRGTIHILVNNSGGPKPGPITDAEPADFLAAFQQHIIAAQKLVQALLPGMKEGKYGRILNVISTSVRIPIANLGVSNTTKGAITSWAKSLSNEVAADGITVNNLLPGLTNTQRLHSLIQAEARRLDKTEEEIRSGMINSIPAKRFGDPSELANLACFLASPLAAYINGNSITIDGGRTGSI